MAVSIDQCIDLKEIIKKVDTFCHEREWDKFHTPKNLSMALTVEAAELQEIFQWLPDFQYVQDMDEVTKKSIEHEVADVMIYLLRFCSVSNIDLLMVVEEKILINAKKYPVDVVKGKSNKYTDYQS